MVLAQNLVPSFQAPAFRTGVTLSDRLLEFLLQAASVITRIQKINGLTENIGRGIAVMCSAPEYQGDATLRIEQIKSVVADHGGKDIQMSGRLRRHSVVAQHQQVLFGQDIPLGRELHLLRKSIAT